jgi:hypothetical protein
MQVYAVSVASSSKRHFRLYIDESGDHVCRDRARLGEERHRYLCVVGCWFVQRPDYLDFRTSLEMLKQDKFGGVPDPIDPTPVVLHREDMVQHRGPFWRLRDDAFRRDWNAALLSVLSDAKFTVFGTVIDKQSLTAQYVRPFDPYHVALSFLLQRYCGYLLRFGGVGDIVAESRGAKEDERLQRAFGQIMESGDVFGQRHSEFYADAMATNAVMFRRKHENVAGLQLADLLAHPLRRYALLKSAQTAQRPTAFENDMFGVITRKFNRRVSDGRALGYGWNVFPRP